MFFLLLLISLLTPSLAAQPVLAGVEVYGARKVGRERILRLVGASKGTPLPKSKGEIEEKLEDLEEIVAARVEAFCCDQGRPILYVGLLERGALAFQYKPWPEKEVELPSEITSAWADFTSALARASAEGDTSEDLSQGHSLMLNLPARVAQERFIALAELNLALLRDVLANAFDPEQRTIAAFVLGYAPVKRDVVNDLQSALQDPSPSVRANAARALLAFAAYKPGNPELRVTIRPTWFVEMLNSVELQDRVEGSRALAFFTETPDEHLATQIRERALQSLLEMASWQHLPHALPPFIIAARLAGWPEDRLTKAWASANRESALKEITKSLTIKPKAK